MRRTVQVRLELDESELLDASDELQQLLDQDRDGHFCPPIRHLLAAVDDAITEAFCGPAPTRARPRLLAAALRRRAMPAKEGGAFERLGAAQELLVETVPAGRLSRTTGSTRRGPA